MKLLEVVESLPQLDDRLTIYAQRPWNSQSAATTALEQENGPLEENDPPKGYEYFVEVFIAREFLVDWCKTQDAPVSSINQCMRLIRYAEDDA